MKTTFKVNKGRDLKLFFKFETEYLDLLITSNAVALIHCTKEVYMQKVFTSLVPIDYVKDICFRVEKETFMGLVRDGTVDIFVDDFGGVELTFSGGNTPSRTLSMKIQDSSMAMISSKMEIFSHQHKFHQEDLSSLGKHLGWYSVESKIMTVRDGYISYESQNRRIYHKVKCCDLCASVQHLRHLLTFCTTYYMFQDYIIGVSDDAKVVVQQTSAVYFGEMKQALNLGASHEVKLNLKDVYSLLKMFPKFSTVLLDIEGGSSYIEGNNGIKVSVNVKVEQVQTAKQKKAASNKQEDLSSLLDMNMGEPAAITKKYGIPRLVLPSNVVVGALSSKIDETLTLYVKKDVVQISSSSELHVILSKVVA